MPTRTYWLDNSILAIEFSGSIGIDDVLAATDEIITLADQQTVYVLADFTNMTALSANIIAAISANRTFMRMVRHDKISYWTFVKPNGLARTAIQVFIPKHKGKILNSVDEAQTVLKSAMQKS